MSFKDQIHKIIKYSLNILLFLTGTAFTQPPPGFTDNNNLSHDNTERNEIKKLDIGFIYQSTKINYQSDNSYDGTALYVPAFMYEASENLINSKKMNMRFNANYCYYEMKNDYGRYDNEYLDIELTANVKKYFTELFMGGGLYTYNYLSDYEFISLSFDLMLGFDTQSEYITLLTPVKTYKEGFYSELVLRKNFYYNDSDYDPSTFHAAAGYNWADWNYYYVNSIKGKLEIPVGDEEYTKFFASNDFRIDINGSINIGLYLDAKYIHNNYASKYIYNINQKITYYLKKIYIQPFYNYEYINFEDNDQEVVSTENSTLGLKVAVYWQE